MLLLVLNFSWLILIISFIYLYRLTFLPKSIQCACVCFLVIYGVRTFMWQNISELTLGSVSSIVRVNPNTIDIRDNFFVGTMQLYTDNRKETISVIGKDLPIESVLQVEYWEIEGQLQPFEKARNFGVTDFQKVMQSNGIKYQLTIDTIVQRQSSSRLLDKLEQWRWCFLQHFKQYDKSVIVSMYNKLVWNLNSEYYRQSRAMLLELGVIHFFALSGLHVSLLKKQLDRLFRRLGVLVEWCPYIVTTLLLLYAFITGFPIGVIRAIGVDVIKKRTGMSQLDSLSILCLIICFVQPYCILSVGFQLSFLISYVLIWIGQMEFTHGKAFQTTFICTLFTWPISLSIGHIWYPLQIVWATIIGWLFERLFLLFVCVITMLTWHSLGVSCLISVESFLFNALEKVSFYQPRWIVGALDSWKVMVLFIVACIWLLTKSWWRYVSLSVYILLVLLSGRTVMERIIILDVGQGDAVLIQRAFDNGIWLIDVGGQASFSQDNGMNINEKYAYNTLIPALHALGIQKIHGVIITHSDIDHIGNLPVLAKEYAIQNLIITQQTKNSTIFESMQADISYIPYVYTLQYGEKIQIYGIESLQPVLSEQRTQGKDNNDSSIASYISLGEALFLNLGDLSQQAEVQLLELEPERNVDIIKLGHHGSNTSTSEVMLEYMNPFLAVISAGNGNRYGHPHKEVIEKLEKAEVPYLSTSDVGAIELAYHTLTKEVTVRTVLERIK